MELESLMSGIAVVIDDQIENTATEGDDEERKDDLIVRIVEQIGQQWTLPFYKASKMPPKGTRPNLLQAASFILLDWQLWPSNASLLEEEGIKENIQFLEEAKDYFVPVFIFTNESPEEIKSKLPETIYREESPEKSFVFIQAKVSLMSDDNSIDLSAVEKWLSQNASVYALKIWEKAFYAAKKDLFSSMYSRSPDWPKVFWKAYEDDSVDPSASLTHLINDNLRGRMQTGLFEKEILAASPPDVCRTDLQALIGETSFRAEKKLSGDEIRCGDLFKQPGKKFLLNLRPDCDCIPRGGAVVDEMDLYCVEGKIINPSQLDKNYKEGHFDERVWESIAFSIYDGKSIRFDFRKLSVKKFSTLKEERIGRLLHPYVTRIQQRYALYMQRQALPRIPEAAVLLGPVTT